jgi:hypothetical protein
MILKRNNISQIYIYGISCAIPIYRYSEKINYLKSGIYFFYQYDPHHPCSVKKTAGINCKVYSFDPGSLKNLTSSPSPSGEGVKGVRWMGKSLGG